MELGLTQTELADLAVWSQRRISQLESGKLSATMDSIEDLALALRKTPADLVTPHKR
jgi:transcriptional regulator with XRE-family HTH domain